MKNLTLALFVLACCAATCMSGILDGVGVLVPDDLCKYAQPCDANYEYFVRIPISDCFSNRIVFKAKFCAGVLGTYYAVFRFYKYDPTQGKLVEIVDSSAKVYPEQGDNGYSVFSFPDPVVVKNADYMGIQIYGLCMPGFVNDLYETNLPLSDLLQGYGSADVHAYPCPHTECSGADQIDIQQLTKIPSYYLSDVFQFCCYDSVINDSLCYGSKFLFDLATLIVN